MSKDPAHLLLKEKYEMFKTGFNAGLEPRVCVDYFGDFYTNSIASISDNIEQELSATYFSKNLKKKAFVIAIEGMQNILRHGFRNHGEEALGAFLLVCEERLVQLHFFNLVSSEAVASMKKYCDKLASLSLVQTKSLYLQTLADGNITNKGGASLGCMLMKLKSDGNIKYTFESKDNHLFCFHLILSIQH